MEQPIITLDGEWEFKIDRLDHGFQENYIMAKSWESGYSLPACAGSNGIGEREIVDMNVLTKDAVKRLRQRHQYVGVIWVRKTFYVEDEAVKLRAFLTLERVMFSTFVFLNDHYIGCDTSLSTPHHYELTEYIKAGENTIVIRIDNRDCENIGIYPSAYTDETQTIWNGIIGNMFIRFTGFAILDHPRIHTDIEKKTITLNTMIHSTKSADTKVCLSLLKDGILLAKQSFETSLQEGDNRLIATLAANTDILLWDEFEPNTYDLDIHIVHGDSIVDKHTTTIGFREIKTQGQHIHINNRRVFMRGTIDCCLYPKTGYPPTDVESYIRIFQIVKDHGLNHVRYHSWCPPQAAFTAANQLGVYLQVEGPIWLDNWMEYPLGSRREHYSYLPVEAKRIIDTYGNNPSFCMFSNGNEINGDFNILKDIISHIKEDRFLFTLTTNWDRAISLLDDYYIAQSVRDVGVRGQYDLNKMTEGTMLHYDTAISQIDIPVISHEVGQYCVFPDIREIKKYDGLLYPANLIAIRNQLEKRNLLSYHERYVYASAKLAGMLYKDEIESALRTKDFSGFQLLGLHDFSGQSTATIGILDAFWDSKGIVSADDFKKACNELVPLGLIEKRVYRSSETISCIVKVANYTQARIEKTSVHIRLYNHDTTLYDQTKTVDNIDIGLIEIDHVCMLLDSIKTASVLKLAITVANYTNEWDIWVYPDTDVKAGDIIVCRHFEELEGFLKNGKTVLFLPDHKEIRSYITGKFFPVFWSPVHFSSQDSCGMFIDKSHSVFSQFPTKDYAQYQWKPLLENSITMDISASSIEPITMVVPNYFHCGKYTNLFEANVYHGKLVVCSIDIEKDDLVMKAFKNSLYTYMNRAEFMPCQQMTMDALKDIFVVFRDENKEKGIDIALNKPTMASSEKSEDNSSEKGNDGSDNTYWCASDSENGHWWQVDLGEIYTITGVRVVFSEEANYKYVLLVSTDGETFTTAVNETGQIEKFMRRENDFHVAARYVRIVYTTLPTGVWAAHKSFEVF